MIAMPNSMMQLATNHTQVPVIEHVTSFHALDRFSGPEARLERIEEKPFDEIFDDNSPLSFEADLASTSTEQSSSSTDVALMSEFGGIDLSAIAQFERPLDVMEKAFDHWTPGSLEAGDKLGNFEIQTLMSDYNQAETLGDRVMEALGDTWSDIIGKF